MDIKKKFDKIFNIKTTEIEKYSMRNTKSHISIIEMGPVKAMKN
jgi:hypothetical protein